MVLLGAIADDVTGAADLASTLTREGMRTVQVLGPEPPGALPEADALVVALKSRTAPVSEAVHDSTTALAWLRGLGVRQVFFKYCSTFDSTPEGNIGPVADALLDELATTFTVICPAYPANGRTVYRGHLFVGDRLLSESSLARHPLTPMEDPNIVRLLARQTSRRIGLVPYEVVAAGSLAIEARLDELRREGNVYAVVDALDEGHLRAIGEACAGLPLVTGGAGVALGLPANFRARGVLGTAAATAELSADGPAVVLAGSCSEATREQVRRLAQRRPAFRIDPLAAVDVAGLGDELLAGLADGPVLVYSTAPPDQVARVQKRLGVERASKLVETTLARLARHVVAGGARKLVIAGGETSAAVLQALGVRALAVGPELAPGVPWMRALGELELTVALKSGNFGGADFFLEAVA